jgi:hypothetical protein
VSYEDVRVDMAVHLQRHQKRGGTRSECAPGVREAIVLRACINLLP